MILLVCAMVSLGAGFLSGKAARGRRGLRQNLRKDQFEKVQGFQLHQHRPVLTGSIVTTDHRRDEPAERLQ